MGMFRKIWEVEYWSRAESAAKSFHRYFTSCDRCVRWAYFQLCWARLGTCRTWDVGCGCRDRPNTRCLLKLEAPALRVRDSTRASVLPLLWQDGSCAWHIRVARVAFYDYFCPWFSLSLMSFGMSDWGLDLFSRIGVVWMGEWEDVCFRVGEWLSGYWFLEEERANWRSDDF